MPAPSRSTDLLRNAPATVPAIGALLVFVVWATDQVGYPVTHWAPGALIVLGLLAVALAVVPLRLAEVGRSVLVALACLAAFTAWSYLSILWAGARGDALEGANRTLLYLVTFALFALWRQHGRSAALLLVAWTLAIIGLAAFVALHISSAGHTSGLFVGARLAYPAGYPNADAATWLMAMWPALLLAASRELPWALRGVLAGGAVLLLDVALLSQSRGAFYATPVMLVLVFAALPGRVRTFAVLVPAAAAAAAVAPAVLRVGDRLSAGQGAQGALHTATAEMFAAALVAGSLVAAGAAVESRGTLSTRTRARVYSALRATAIATTVLVIAGGFVAAGDPVARARSAWSSFKHGYGSNGSGNRLVSGLGSNRYDFYRVALDSWLAHPLNGIGADNFAQQYLVHGRSDETPHYPHSVELRTLAQTGVVGALLLLGALGGALVAALRATRAGEDALARVAACAALAGAVYWLVHGSFDWFWEFAGLGAPAFALLGLACALAPRGPAQRPGGGPLLRGRAAVLVAVLVALLLAAGAVALAAPWLSQREIELAARTWPTAPHQAYVRLDRAAQLDPLSDEPYLVAGSIALRFGDYRRADHEFALALARTTDGAYATLERGAIASALGDEAHARMLLARAAQLAPRDPATLAALATVRHSGRVDVTALNRAILQKAQQLG